MLSMLSQPKQQNAEATIITLCDRLAHSTEIEDRRAAALALKGFSHSYRELIASSGLQGLIDALKTDSHDQDLRRACLETLIVLFVKTGNGDLVETARRARERNKTYVSPLVGRNTAGGANLDTSGDEISLLLTDRFTQLPENIELLLRFVEDQPDVFSTLYSLQLISAIVLNRPDRAREALMSTPNGISLLVKTLESSQEMVRNEGILLLRNLTENDIDSQKLVAFEGAFDYIIHILNEEGGLAFGTQQIVDDCLGLLANLVEYNVSNQKLFCQSNLPDKFGSLLDFGEDDAFQNDASVANIVTALEFPRLFCVPDAQATTSNQQAFGEHFLLKTLRLAFGPAPPLSVRTASLVTCASLIWSNKQLQQTFVELDVPYYDLSVAVNVVKKPTVAPVTAVLLNWMCLLNTTQTFDLRAACLLCLTSLFQDNQQLQTQFVEDQHSSYKSGTSENCNIISLLAEYNESVNINPFQVWFACALLNNLLQVSHTIKDQVRDIKIGDEQLGQDVAPIIQSIGSQLLASLSYREPFVALGYLQLLSIWLFDDVSAVNEILTESAVIQSLVHYVVSNHEVRPNVLVQSLATILLGIAYDFSSKDSPFNRAELHNLLVSTLGKDQFVHQIRRFRESPHFRDYSHASIFGAPKGENGLPEIYLEDTFVEFIGESIGRIQKALNKGPDFEPTSRISLEMYEELREQKTETESRLKEMVDSKQAELAKLEKSERKVTGDLEDLRRDHSALVTSNTKLASEHEALKTKLAETTKALGSVTTQLNSLKKAHEKIIAELESVRTKSSTSEKNYAALQVQLKKVSDSKEKAESGINKMTRELMTLNKERDALDKELKGLKGQHDKLVASEKDLGAVKKTQDAQLAELKSSNTQLKATNDKLVAKLRETAEILEQKEEDDALLESAIEDVEKYQGELKAAHSRIQNFERENKLIKGKLDTATKESKAQSDRATQLASELEDQLKQLKSAQVAVDELSTLKLALESEKRANKNHQEEITKLKSEVSGQLEQLESCQGAANELVEQKLALESEKRASSDAKSAFFAEITELKSKIKAAEAEKIRLEAEISESADAKKILQGELDSKSKQVGDLEAKNTALQQLQGELDTLKKHLGKVENELADKEKQINDLETSKKELETLHVAAVTEVRESHTKALAAQVNEHKNVVDGYETKLKNLQEKHSQSSKSLQASHSEALAEAQGTHASDLKQAKDAHTKACEELEKQLATSKSKVSTLQDSLDKLKKEAEGLTIDKTKLSETVSKLDEELKETKSAHVSEIDSAKAKASKALASANEKEAAHTGRISDLEGELAEAKAETEKLRQSLNESVATLKDELEATKSSNKGVSDKLIESFKAKVNAKETKISELEAEFKASQKKGQNDIKDLKAKIKKAEEEATSLAAQHSEALKLSGDKVKELESAKTKAIDELSQLKKELSEARAETVKELEALKVASSESAASSLKDLELKHGAALEAKNSEVSELRSQLAKHGDTSKEIAALQKEISDIKARDEKAAQEFRMESEAQSKEIAGLKKKLEAAAAKDEKITRLSAQVKSSEESKAKEVCGLQKQLDSATSKGKQVSELKEQIEKAEAKARKLQKDLEDTTKKDKVLVEQVSAKDKQLEDLQKQVDAAAAKDKEIEALQKQVDAAAAKDKQLQDLQKQVDAASLKLKESELKAAQVSKLEASLSAAETKVAELENAASSVPPQDATQLRSLLDEKSSALDELMELLEELENDKAKYKSKVKDLGHEVSDSEEEDE